MNIHEHHRGRTIRTLPGIRRKRFPADWKGWGEDSFLYPIPEGLTGTIVSVESHGNAPFTRYYVKFDDGSWVTGIPATEFEFELYLPPMYLHEGDAR